MQIVCSRLPRSPGTLRCGAVMRRLPFRTAPILGHPAAHSQLRKAAVDRRPSYGLFLLLVTPDLIRGPTILIGPEEGEAGSRIKSGMTNWQ